MSLTSLDAGSFAAIIDLLPLKELCYIPRLSKSTNESCRAVEGGWSRLVDSRLTRFRDQCKYASRPTGWYNWINVYTVCVPPAGKKRKRAARFRMIKIGDKRCKVHLTADGVEYLVLGKGNGAIEVHADSTNIDLEAIAKNNEYWSHYK